MSFDLKHIESFVYVAETLSFSAAAERSNTVQSAISAHISLLEKQVSRTLVQRGRGQPVILTAQGAAFLVQARRLLALTDEMASRPDAASSAAPIRLGTTVTFALSVVPKVLSAYGEMVGGGRVTVRTARSHDLIDLLDQSEIDAALVFDQGAHPSRKTVMKTDLSWVASDDFVHDGKSPLPLAFLEDAKDLRRHAFSALDADASQSASLHSHPDPIGMRAVVEAGLEITVLPKVAIAGQLVDVGSRLGLPELGTMLVSIYTKLDRSDGDFARFSSALEAQFQDAK